MRVNLRRFFAYSVLASWIGLTPVTIWTAIQWSTQKSEEQVTFQRSKDIRDDLLKAKPTTPTDAAQLEAQLKSGIKSTQALDNKVLDAARAATIKRKEFSWEFLVWVGLTLLGSALLAEYKGQLDASN